MDNLFNKTLLAFAILGSAALILILPKIDLTRNYYIVIFFLFFTLASLLATIDLKKMILIFIAVLPSVLIFHNFKIKLDLISHSLANISLPINFTALIAVCFIYFALITAFSNFKQIKELPLKTAFVPYFAFVIISIFWTSDLADSLVGLIYSLAPLAIFILTNIHFNSKKDLAALWITGIISAAGPLLISLWQLASKQFFYEPDSSLARIQGTFNHPNLFGLYLFIILSLIAIFYYAQDKKLRAKNQSLLVYAIVLFFIFILTFSRTAWLCSAIFLLFFAVIETRIITLSIAMAPVALFMSFAVDSLKERIWGMQNYIYFNSVTARKRIWKVAYNEMETKPWFGHGVGTAETVIKDAKSWSGGTSLPHNDFILHGVEYGLIGLALYANLLLQTVAATFKAFRQMDSKPVAIAFGSSEYRLDYRLMAYGLFSLFLTLQAATMFESVSREIVPEIIVWSLIGSMLSLKKD